MTGPDFLGIGGMKCGSTTLYEDLLRTGNVSFPGKELNFFNRPGSVEAPAVEAYRRRFIGAGVQGDISTSYAMVPRYDGTAGRARVVLGSVPVVYMVRNPIERALSHHHHLLARGATQLDFENALEAFPEIVGFGQYEIQAAEWDKEFDSNEVLVTPLERYSTGGFEDILRHIGVEHGGASVGHSNATESARVFTGRSRAVYESAVFQRLYVRGLRTVVPSSARTRARSLLLPKPPARPAPPASNVLNRLAALFEPTVEFVEARTGLRWDLSETCDMLREVR